MKRGCDLEVDLLSRLLPVVTSDIFQPADILNRLLAEFMSATRPSVAIRLTPTIFQVRCFSLFLFYSFVLPSLTHEWRP